MKNCLLIDFGASRIKSAVVNLKDARLSSVLDLPVPGNCSQEPGHFEISLDSLRKQFERICRYYFRDLKIEYGGVFLCSQMHGFILFNDRGKPLSNYISWRDERSLEKVKGAGTFTILNRQIADEFKAITGMKLRPGLPFSNIVHLAREKTLKKPFKIVSLPEFLSMRDRDCTNLVHDTMLAGIGFYDIRKKMVSKKLLDIFKNFSGVSPYFNNVAREDRVSGCIRFSSKKIPIFTGVGDFQCAVLGAGNKIAKTVSVNIGTGSQVCVICERIKPGDYEFRPYFDNLYLRAFTHIPAGRVLQEFINLIAPAEKEEKNIWKKLKNINLSEIEKSTLNFNLNIFKSAWKYESGGGISNIHESTLTRKNYLASLLRNLMLQYAEAIDLIADNRSFDSIIMSGGIARKLPKLSPVLAKLTKKKVLINRKLDETLIGLRYLALAVAGKELGNES